MTTRSEVVEVDVLVIGAGVIGIAAAHRLAQRGRDVVVVDSRSAAGAECSYGNAGLISPSHCIPLARPGVLRQLPRWLFTSGAVRIKPRLSPDLARFGLRLSRSATQEQMMSGLRALRDLARASRDLFEDLVRDGLDFGYRRDGVMNVCSSQRAYEALCEDAELLRTEGFDPEVLGPREARKMVPMLRDDVAGAVYWEEDAHCDPARFVRELSVAAETEGARFHADTTVVSFELGIGGAITHVHSTSGDYRPTTVVLAAGAWTAPLARAVGTRIPMEAGKGYHAHFRDVAGQRLNMPLIFQESVFAATPIGEDIRLAGTMEFVGLDLTLRAKKTARLVVEANTYLERVAPGSAYESWCGLRPCTPDSLPIVGISTRVPNLIFATGHAMLGLTLAPVTGQAIADLVMDGGTALPIESLAPRRFGA
jgi:D-amino-acid dehydrogenase